MTVPSITLIAGATASGKSALALKLARQSGAVIINADSQQLYSGLRILTARPTREDEIQAPHRLYGIADPAEAWSVGRWLREVEALMSEEARPLIFVGGTGLYFTALTQGLADIPPVPDAIRAEVQQAFDADGELTIRTRLAQADPEAERRIASGDQQRLVRALSVALATGRSLTAWQADVSDPLVGSAADRLVLERDREALYARCDARVDSMLAEGAQDEVRDLNARRLDKQLPAMKAVGVRELAAVLDGRMALNQAREAMKTATRQYAKRQLTWFRNQLKDWPRHEA